MSRSAAPWHVSNLDLVVARLRQCLPPGNKQPESRTQTLLEKYDKTPGDFTIAEIFELDAALHSCLPTVELLNELPMLRLRYREAVGEKQYAAYKPFDAGPAPDLNDPQVRSSLLAD